MLHLYFTRPKKNQACVYVLACEKLWAGGVADARFVVGIPLHVCDVGHISYENGLSAVNTMTTDAPAVQTLVKTPDWQTLRVFISSTFRDMHGERAALTQRVFPALRRRLMQQVCRRVGAASAQRWLRSVVRVRVGLQCGLKELEAAFALWPRNPHHIVKQWLAGAGWHILS